MALMVKIMSGENLPDDDARKSFRIFTNVTSVDFRRGTTTASVWITTGGTKDGWVPERFDVEGNVYLMNESGKTISTFCPSDPFPPK